MNLASGLEATVGGGDHNTASGTGATVAGGSGELVLGGGVLQLVANTASGNGSTVGGGQDNTASGTEATVPGGLSNTAAGVTSFAAGNRAKANHGGTFVWADSTAADFISTGSNQFLIRTQGGVGINTASPAKPLDVAGSGGMRISQTANASSQNELLFQDNGQIRSFDDNHRIIFDRANNILELREFGSIHLSSGATAGTRTSKAVLDGNGNLTILGSLTQGSSRRWKTNIRTLDGALAKVAQLRGVSYDRKANGRHEIGVIAEEVGQVVPEVVSYEENGADAVGVDYGRLTALLIEAVKEQQAQIRELKAENEKLSKLAREVEELRGLVTRVVGAQVPQTQKEGLRYTGTERAAR